MHYYVTLYKTSSERSIGQLKKRLNVQHDLLYYYCVLVILFFTFLAEVFKLSIWNFIIFFSNAYATSNLPCSFFQVISFFSCYLFGLLSFWDRFSLQNSIIAIHCRNFWRKTFSAFDFIISWFYAILRRVLQNHFIAWTVLTIFMNNTR